MLVSVLKHFLPGLRVVPGVDMLCVFPGQVPFDVAGVGKLMMGVCIFDLLGALVVSGFGIPLVDGRRFVLPDP